MSAMGNALSHYPQTKYNLLTTDIESLHIPSTELAIFGVPVYSGRVPKIALDTLRRIKGDGTPAILFCVYGNRAFDDALVELQDVVESNGFVVLSAAAFVAQHSIFPHIAADRPDASDLEKAAAFAIRSLRVEMPIEKEKFHIRGNHSYRNTKNIPFTPRRNNAACNGCGLCIRQCPVQAIDPNTRRIDKSLCLSCAHCIAICPSHAKRFGGVLYWYASRKFKKAYSTPQEPYMVYRS